MPKGYWIGHVDVHDAGPYGEYAALAREAVHKYGGRYLVRRGACEIPEGEWREIHVVIEFPSFQRAQECFHSPEYQAARALRLPAATAELLIIEGSDEDQ
jgi:uncharacterized protein (DUF1330 family)